MNSELGSLLNPVPADRDPERPRPLEWQAYSDQVQGQWFSLLASSPDEPQVQAFLELHPAMIPGGSGDIGPGGHHGSDLGLVFCQPRLEGAGRELVPDFMWVTRSSGLITPILIEIEKPSKEWFRQDGRPTRHFTDARDQLTQWRDWFSIDGNSTIFRNKFQLLGDRYPSRPLAPQFLLIYGRESEFEYGVKHRNPDELNRKRQSLRRADETFMTFDSLRPRYDHSSTITATMTATGVELFAFSPVFESGPQLMAGIRRVAGADTALDRSTMISVERRNYLKERWQTWTTHSTEEEQSGRSWAYQLGSE